MNLESVLAQLQGVKRNGVGWQARCPAHEDKNPSLCLVGHPAEMRAAEPWKQKHDRREADLILKLLAHRS